MKISETIKVHLTPELRRQVELTAEEEGRSLSNVVRRVVSQWAKQRAAERSQQQAA
jgi:predicted HicB family RNase H-like nuclease